MNDLNKEDIFAYILVSMFEDIIKASNINYYYYQNSIPACHHRVLKVLMAIGMKKESAKSLFDQMIVVCKKNRQYEYDKSSYLNDLMFFQNQIFLNISSITKE